ncbi:MAG: UvrD-helicase domain-containing protein [Muribaculaceae bacterium]|nr:UvrD-helicase domain-containing protein [Muribaculaceae bacterium]
MSKSNQQHQGLLVIKASAGSGKTYSLTKLYIEQLLFRPSGPDGLLELRNKPDYHKHILAITFTNKATDEMKRRIVKELYTISQDVAQSDYCDYFSQRCTTEAFQGLQQAATDALNSILMNYSTFMVSTIDSFFQSILRSFARELDRDYNYELQIDEDHAVKTAVHNFLISLGRDRDRTGKNGSVAENSIEQWVQGFIRSDVEQSKTWRDQLTKSLPDFARKINSELFRSRMDAIRSYLSREDENGQRITDLSRIQQFLTLLVKARNHYDEQYRNDFNGKLEQLLGSHGIDSDTLSGNKPLKTFILNNKMSEDKEPTATLLSLDADGVCASFKKNQAPAMDVVDEIMGLVNQILQTYNRRELLSSIIKHLGLLGLLGAIDEKLEDYRKDTNAILIGDTNELISRLVGDANRADSSMIPFIYERVGTWINHYMIDEFQDTSHKQYDNFLPLLYESLSHGEDNFNMIIGDAKQSIYRFRNADPSLFRDAINEDFKRFHLQNENLPTNYRSLPAVIDFNNELFRLMIDHYTQGSEPAVADIVRRTYMPTNQLSDFQQQKHKESPAGFVRIISSDPEGKELAFDDVLEQLPAYLLQLHERYEWQQMGVLVSTNSEGNAIVERLLEHNITADEHEHINVMSDESMLLKNAPTVRRIISMLRFVDLVQYQLHDEQELDEDVAKKLDASIKSHVNKTRLNNQRISHALGKFIAALAHESNVDATTAGRLLEKSFEDVPDERNRPLDELMSTYAQELQRLLPDPSTNLLTLTTIVENILRQIMDKAAQKDTAFLLGFQSCVAAFAATSPGGTVREFLQYWDQRKDKLAVASTSTGNAITVMTIHKSKGLEFDCVVVPFANWEMDSNSQESYYWMPSEYWHLNDDGQALFGSVPGISYQAELVPPLVAVGKKQVKALMNRENKFAEFVNKCESDVLIDNLNKTYVAFTRPREELHVFISKPKKPLKTHLGSVLQSLIQALPGIAQSPEGYWQLGTPRTERKSVNPGDDDDIIVPIDMPPYYVAPTPSKVNVKLPREISRQQREGLRVHDVLSLIEYRSDVPRAIRYGQYHGIIGTSDGQWSVQELKRQLEQLFTQPLTASWFADENKVYTERSIISPENKEVKRPDRLVRRPDDTFIVIDYKTGEQRKRDVKQVADYMTHLRRMGHQRVEGYLLYLDQGQPPGVVPVNIESSIL